MRNPRATVCALAALVAGLVLPGVDARAEVGIDWNVTPRSPEDIKALGLDVLRHRVILTYRADADGIDSDELLRRIFEAVPVP